MRKIEINVYNFDELDESVKMVVIEFIKENNIEFYKDGSIFKEEF